MSATKYHCASQQRILKVLLCLFGHEIDGLTPGQVAKLAGITPANATRDLWNLQEAGLVERLPGGDAVRISPKLGRKALATVHAFDRAQRSLTDLANRYINQPTN
jgi:DNA-binding IclR family transcriptional regulator